MQIQSEYHRYYLTTCIKQHEYGTVYRGRTRESAPFDVVVKIFNKQLISLRERQRFLQEMNLIASLRHPALLPVLETGIDHGSPYLVREYVPAGSLITQLAQQNGGAFSLPKVVSILTQVGTAVTYLHKQQISHGSIKPENILFNVQQQALLADICVTSVLPDVSSTTHKLVMTWGKTQQNKVTQDGIQDDIYAFSSMAYELLTGHQPFASKDVQDAAPIVPSHWIPSLSKQVDQVFVQALNPQPEERFSSAMLFVEALQDSLNPLFIEEKDTISVEHEKEIILQPNVGQHNTPPIQKPAQQFISDPSSIKFQLLTPRPLLARLQWFASDLSSTTSHLTTPRPLTARLPQPTSDSAPTTSQLSTPRPLTAQLPQPTSDPASTTSQLTTPRPLTAQLPQLTFTFSPTRIQSFTFRALFARLVQFASILASIWSQLPPPRALFARLAQFASVLTSIWSQLPPPRALLARLAPLASTLSSIWSQLPPPRALLARLAPLASTLSSARVQSPLLRLPLTWLSDGRKLFSSKLPLIILAALLVLVSIFISTFTFHLHTSQLATTHEMQNQAHIKLTAMSQTHPIIIALKTRKQGQTQVAHPASPAPPVPPVPPTVINASFETPLLTNDFQAAPDNSGWTFSSDTGVASNGSDLTQGTDNAPLGDQVAFIRAYGSMSQDITFAGGTYRVLFLAAQRVNSSSTQSLSVFIDDTLVGTITPTGASYIYYTTASFTVEPGMHTLTFKGLQGGAHNTAFIDSVSIVKG